MTAALFDIARYLLTILWWLIIIQVVLSWLFAFNVLNTSSRGVLAFTHALERITAPLYRPIRRLLPDFGGLDFSPLVVLILIQILQMLLDGAERSLTKANHSEAGSRENSASLRHRLSRSHTEILGAFVCQLCRPFGIGEESRLLCLVALIPQYEHTIEW